MAEQFQYNNVVFNKQTDNSYDVVLTNGKQNIIAGTLSFDPNMNSYVQTVWSGKSQSPILYDKFISSSQQQIKTYYLLDAKPQMIYDFRTHKAYNIESMVQEKAKKDSVHDTAKQQKEYSPEAKLAFHAKNLLKVRTSDPSKLERLITQTGHLLKYSINNQLMLMNQNQYGQYFAGMDEYKNDPQLANVDFTKLKPARIMKPVQANGQPTRFKVTSVYSARDIGKAYPSLQQAAYAVTEKFDNTSKTRYQSRLTATNNALKENYVPIPSQTNDPDKALRSRITRYLVRRYSGVEKHQFKFTDQEKQIMAKMSPEQLQSMYVGCNRLAKKVSRTVEKNLRYAPKINKRQVKSQSKEKAKGIIR